MKIASTLMIEYPNLMHYNMMIVIPVHSSIFVCPFISSIYASIFACLSIKLASKITSIYYYTPYPSSIYSYIDICLIIRWQLWQLVWISDRYLPQRYKDTWMISILMLNSVWLQY